MRQIQIVYTDASTFQKELITLQKQCEKKS